MTLPKNGKRTRRCRSCGRKPGRPEYISYCRFGTGLVFCRSTNSDGSPTGGFITENRGFYAATVASRIERGEASPYDKLDYIGQAPRDYVDPFFKRQKRER